MTSRRIALITGASGGIGAATALRMAQAGFDLVLHYHQNRQGANDLARQCRERESQVWLIQADLREETAIEHLFAEIDAHCGPLHALINNAGIVQPQMRVETMSAARLTNTFASNVLSVFLCSREAVKRMSTRHGGRGGVIVNVSSAAARLGSPGEYVDYAAAKAAIDALTKGLSLEVASEGIRVNAVRPGYIDTPIHAKAGDPRRLARLAPNIPMQRCGQSEEVAHAIHWLASDEASYVTGAFIDCAGGR